MRTKSLEYEEFIEQAQKRAYLTSKIEASSAIRPTLETLGEHYDAASELSREVAMYLKEPFLGPGNQPAPRPNPDVFLNEFLSGFS